MTGFPSPCLVININTLINTSTLVLVLDAGYSFWLFRGLAWAKSSNQAPVERWLGGDGNGLV